MSIFMANTDLVDGEELELINSVLIDAVLANLAGCMFRAVDGLPPKDSVEHNADYTLNQGDNL